MPYRATYWFTDGRRFSELLDDEDQDVRDYVYERDVFTPFPNTDEDRLIFGLVEALEQSDYAAPLFQNAKVFKVVVSKE